MRGEVLERVEAAAELVHVETVEDGGRLAQAEVAGGPRARAREVAGEEPLGRPRAEAAERRDRGAHLVVAERAASPSRSRSERASPTTYSALRREKPSATSSASLAAATRSRVGNAYACSPRSPNRSISRLRIANAEKSETCCAVIEVTSALERVGRERRPEAREPRHELVEHRLARRPGAERLELELGAEQLQHDRPRLVVERLDVDPARRRLDPHLAPADDAVQAAVVPEVREVGPNARKRSVESSKSYGSGKRSSNVVEGLERLERHALAVEVLRERARREDAVGGERGAAVGVAVADVDERPPGRAARAACRGRRRPGTARRRPRGSASRRAAGRAGSRRARPRRPRARGSARSSRRTRSRARAARTARRARANPARTSTCSTRNATASASGTRTVASCALHHLAVGERRPERVLGRGEDRRGRRSARAASTASRGR